ncbi:MAG: glutathione S-transferase N-terminal domain-containing protein [Bdellovibrionota bacterium]|nr:glutathione S-transferase N-terminal domain-containing protein [Bdellovibrionota bacterium]
MIKLRLILLAFFQKMFEKINKIPIISPFFHYFTLVFSGFVRLKSGNSPLPGAKKPEELLLLYEFEGCPFCRLVRESLSLLSLDVIIYPCPRETLKKYGYLEKSRFRPIVKDLGKKVMFPYLIDPNTKKSMYESRDIIQYLWDHYGRGLERPFFYRMANKRFYFLISSFLHSFLRPLPQMGILRTPSKRPEELLELWSREHDPKAKRIRETLCTLEIPYILHHGSEEKSGTLKDPNNTIVMNSASQSVDYLFKTYQVSATTDESFLHYGKND